MSESPELLAYWINERDSIRRKKEAGKPRPWSEDPIMHHTYFTNVRREDDKVTKWIRANWPCKNMGMVTLARMFNLPSHLDKLLYSEGLRVMEYQSKNLRDDGAQIFNGAYLITTCGVKMDKIEYVYRVARDAGQLSGRCTTLADTHKLLMTVNGLGNFLAAQVVADLKNDKGNPLQTAPDWWTWCAPGPGSIKGIRAVEGFENTTLGGFLPAATHLYNVVHDIGIDPRITRMCMQDFQNCLCEFSKYVRVKAGGHSKRKYQGT